LTLVQGHEVEVFDAFLIILYQTLTKCALANNFSDILKYEGPSVEVSISTKSVTFLLSLDNGHVRILLADEALVLTILPAVAVIGTFNTSSTIYTVRVFSTGEVGVRFGILNWLSVLLYVGRRTKI
jgi:hypothetical protein